MRDNPGLDAAGLRRRMAAAGSRVAAQAMPSSYGVTKDGSSLGGMTQTARADDFTARLDAVYYGRMAIYASRVDLAYMYARRAVHSARAAG